MGRDTVTVSYAEGWDADARRAFGPLTRAEAEERDGARDPYVVLHRVPGRAVPAEVHLVAWRIVDHEGVWTDFTAPAKARISLRQHGSDVQSIRHEQPALRALC